MTEADFARQLGEAVPEAQTLVDEHLHDHGELLLHVLMADVRRFAIEVFERGDRKLLDRCLEFLDLAFRVGDERVENAVSVPCVEDTGWWDPSMEHFVAAWPDALRAEAVRQREWKPDDS